MTGIKPLYCIVRIARPASLIEGLSLTSFFWIVATVAFYAGVERKRKDQASRKKNASMIAPGGSEVETLDDSQEDDMLESVIKSVTTPSSRQTRDRRRARTGTRTSCNYGIF